MKRQRWVLAGATVLVAVTTTGGVIAMSRGTRATPATQAQTSSTVNVVRGKLSAMVSLDGTLTYRGRSDGSPFAAINQRRGTYTWLPDIGAKVDCGGVLYRVDEKPVLLLCGTVPAYRSVRRGDWGDDVRQLNRNLHTFGYDAGAAIDPDDNGFTSKTEKALEKAQHDKGLAVTGGLAIDDAVFLPESARVAKVAGELGGSAQPGVSVLNATSETLEVQVDLEGTQQREVQTGARAQIALPDNTSATGTVDRLGTVAQAPAEQTDSAGKATIRAHISLDDPARAYGLDNAPVQVEITTQGVDNALSVPVTAIVGKSGGGFAVEVVRDGGRRELVAVELGLFDTTAARVQVEGSLGEGDHVVVPSS